MEAKKKKRHFQLQGLFTHLVELSWSLFPVMQMIKCDIVQEKLSLREEGLSIDVQRKNDCQFICDKFSLHFWGGISEVKGFGNSFFKVMNCIEPAY